MNPIHPKPGQPTPNTWGDLYKALDDAEFSADEYLSAYGHYEHPNWAEIPLYDENTRWIACYWVVGGSEGYYVHIERVLIEGDGYRHELMLLAKFWNWERAQECANYAQRLVNHW